MQANEQQGACQGLLAMKHSWPSTLRTIYGDHERYEVTYFAGFKVGLSSGYTAWVSEPGSSGQG